jgi:hypothetical protein
MTYLESMLLKALKEAEEILRHNPNAQEPPRYRNARAGKVIRAAIECAEKPKRDIIEPAW